MKNQVVNSIKDKINVAVNSFAMSKTYGENLNYFLQKHTVLISLNYSFRLDKRPFLTNGKRIDFIDIKKSSIVFEDFSQKNIDSLKVEDLNILNKFLQTLPNA